jgi:hypothetical protein
MRGFRLILLAWAASGCSLLVQFDPETQPCDSAGLCGPGYTCSDAGLCHFTDAGEPGTDAGNPDGSVCATKETNCADGKDDDCDSLTDCLDPDCGGLRCDDKDACTTGDTCTQNLCKGTAMVCNTPPNTCQAQNGSCTAGACVYAPLADGTLCGGGTAAERCCTGTCVNLTRTTTNCGGCGLACATGQTCQAINLEPICVAPSDVSARCSCAAGAPCPSGTGGAQTCAANGLCRPATPTQCAPGESVGDGGVSCGPYCRY